MLSTLLGPLFLLFTSVTLPGTLPSEGGAPEAITPEPVASSGTTTQAGQGLDREQLYRRLVEKTFQDEEAVARGKAGLNDILEAAGGMATIPVRSEEDGAWVPGRVPVWRYLPGLRWQSLETIRTGGRSKGKVMQVFSRVPRTVHVDPFVQGYLYSELVNVPLHNADPPKPLYYREIVSDLAIWTEIDSKQSGRNQRATELASMRFGREVLLGLMPHGISAWGGELAFLESQVRNGEQVDVYLLRIPRKVCMRDHEAFEFLQLYVRQDDHVVLQGRTPDYFSRRPMATFEGSISIPIGAAELNVAKQRWIGDRLIDALAEGTIEADAQGFPVGTPELMEELNEAAELIELPEAIRIPATALTIVELQFEVVSHEKADVQFEPLPEQALVRPWKSSQLWTGAPRADRWDPAPKSEAQE